MPTIDQVSNTDIRYRAFVESRLLGLRDNRYSWWTHWRVLAEYFLPRRYKWLVIANQQNRGSPINQHIIDETGVICARNLAAGLLGGKTPPTMPWVNLAVNRQDSTGTTPVSLWLAECERLIHLIFQESNFYSAIITFYMDLVIFGTSALTVYEDFENVINCYNPCLGEFYVDIDGNYRPVIFYREFTMTISACVDRFGIDNVSPSVKTLYDLRGGAGLTRELIIAHAIEPNDDGRNFGIPEHFKFRECYWEWGGSTSPQNQSPAGFLQKRGFYEQPAFVGRWDLVSNDPYGRSCGMDALGSNKQLQVETRRKGQAIDKMVNPPLVADVQLKNKPASLLPGGITYITGYTSSGKPGISSIYNTDFPVQAITEDLEEVRGRISKIFFNDVIQSISQYETRSNITTEEIAQRRSEAYTIMGPVFERLDTEVLKPLVERVWGIMGRANIIPPPPQSIAGMEVTIRFESMLYKAQMATQAQSIQAVLGFAGNLAGIDQNVMDNIDVDYSINRYSSLLGNDPKMMRTADAVAQIRQDKAKQAQAQQQAENAANLSQAGANLSKIDLGGGTNAAQALVGANG